MVPGPSFWRVRNGTSVVPAAGTHVQRTRAIAKMKEKNVLLGVLIIRKKKVKKIGKKLQLRSWCPARHMVATTRTENV